MKQKISKKEAKEKIDEFFKRNDFSPDDVRKIKRIAMKHNIKLGEYRKRFCKKCLSKLEGRTRITKNYKSVECEVCRHLNKFKLKQT